jgi:hypothetical protein
VRWEEAVSGCRRSERFPTETPGIAGSRALRIRVGCRLGLVRRRTAQHVSALHTMSARVSRTVRFVLGCGKENERNGHTPGDHSLDRAVETKVFDAASAAYHELEPSSVDDPFRRLAAHALLLISL